MTDRPDVLSARNPTVANLRRLLGRRRARAEQGRFVIEGPTLIVEALEAGTEVELILLEAGADLDRAPVQALRAAAEVAGVRVVQLAAGVLGRVTDTVTPQPAVAVAVGRPVSFDRFLVEPLSGLTVVLAGVADPGNAGTLVRTAEATGARAVVFCEGSVDPLGPKTVRATAGSAFRVPLVAGPDVSAVVEALATAGLTTVGTAGRGGEELGASPLPADLALVLGAEAAGIAPELVARLDRVVSIPMAGQVESLNVAVAGSLICFEWARRGRGGAG